MMIKILISNLKIIKWKLLRSRYFFLLNNPKISYIKTFPNIYLFYLSLNFIQHCLPCFLILIISTVCQIISINHFIIILMTSIAPMKAMRIVYSHIFWLSNSCYITTNIFWSILIDRIWWLSIFLKIIRKEWTPTGRLHKFAYVSTFISITSYIIYHFCFIHLKLFLLNCNSQKLISISFLCSINDVKDIRK